MNLPIELRGYAPSDLAFILDTWCKSYRSGSRKQRSIPADDWFPAQKTLISLLLSNAKVVVACDPEHRAQIFGYICYSSHANAVHYLYVKHTYRGFGLGDKLLDTAGRPKYATHWVDWLKRLTPQQFTFNPYPLIEVAYHAGYRIRDEASGSGTSEQDPLPHTELDARAA